MKNDAIRNTGTFPLSHQLLAQLLGLPEGSEIISVKQADYYYCEVSVTHPDMPYDGCKMLPRFKLAYHDPGASAKLIDWGIKDKSIEPANS